MTQFEEQATEKLFEKGLITQEQLVQVKAYRSLGIFSLHAELQALLYLSVVLFTTGIGILIYQNIDTIGHMAILAMLFLIMLSCFYFCFTRSKGFQKAETTFDSPILSYLVLAASILSCIFIGYLQFQYKTFGTHYGLATLIPTIVSFFCAYYFDNKSVLTIGITGLAAYVGLSVRPQDLLNNAAFYSDQSLAYWAILLGGLLILWTIYSTRIALKTHFSLIFLTFALHLISLAALSNLINSYIGIGLVFAVVLAGSSYYFYKVSHELEAISLYIFMIIYGYVGLNIVLFRIFENIDFSAIWELFVFLLPVYFIGSIVLFIKLIKNFNKELAK